MVTTLRDQETFLLEPGSQSNDPHGRPQQYGFILVVEDDAPTLRLERVILEEEGYTVEVVGSGEEAVEFVAGKTPTLILLDIGLPGMDGFATCAKIRETSPVPIIMVTGRDSLDEKVKGMDAGADDYVTKPFLTHELATRVKVVLRRAEATAQAEKDSQYFSSVVQDAPGTTDDEPDAPQERHEQTQAPAVSTTPEPAPESPPPAAVEEVQDTPAQDTSVSVNEEPALAEAAPVAEPALEPPPPAAVEEAPDTPVEVVEAVEEEAEEPSPEPVLENSEESSEESSMEEDLSIEEEEEEEPPRLPASETGIYEGTVRLSVSTLGPVRNLINFVSELRQSPQFRLLRLVANQHKEGMDIWLGLREPVELLTVLGSIAGVNEVVPSFDKPQDQDEELLIVTLN